jgi:hypothetical protein
MLYSSLKYINKNKLVNRLIINAPKGLNINNNAKKDIINTIRHVNTSVSLYFLLIFL